MGLILKILIYFCLCAGVQCVHQIPSLPCQFIDEYLFQNNESHWESKYNRRQAMLQFGVKGDAPVNPYAITFLVIGGKLDLRRYVEGVEAEQLKCELRRYGTKGIHVRWPVKGAQEYSRWFSCTVKHIKGLFTVTSFLRHPSDQHPSAQQDYLNWSVIEDREILTTTVVLVIKTQTPSVTVGLGSQPKLHCQFAIDHKVPNITVEWYWQYRGERERLFSHTSRTGQTYGSGVELKSLAGGDASYTLPGTKINSEGTYICSVAVYPLFISVDIKLHIEEPPRVSLNVGPTLSLQVGEMKKVICDAESYFPRDVEIIWYKQDPAVSGKRVGAPLPKVLQNVLLSSHKQNLDKTHSVLAFFYLNASLKDSGRQFICNVSHQSLTVPIRKSFILTVEGPSNWKSILIVGFTVVTLVVILRKLLLYWRSVRKPSALKKPY